MSEVALCAHPHPTPSVVKKGGCIQQPDQKLAFWKMSRLNHHCPEALRTNTSPNQSKTIARCARRSHLRLRLDHVEGVRDDSRRATSQRPGRKVHPQDVLHLLRTRPPVPPPFRSRTCPAQKHRR